MPAAEDSFRCAPPGKAQDCGFRLTHRDEKAANAESGKAEKNSASQVSASGQQEPLGPGVVYPVPPRPSEDESERTRQNLQRLQRIHEEQQESQPPR